MKNKEVTHSDGFSDLPFTRARETGYLENVSLCVTNRIYSNHFNILSDLNLPLHSAHTLFCSFLAPVPVSRENYVSGSALAVESCKT